VSDELPDLAPLYARQDASDRAWRERRDWKSDPTIAGELSSAEWAHYKAQEPAVFTVDNRPKSGTIVLDKDGDGWVFGTSRWTQISGNDDKFLRVPSLAPWNGYGPYRVIGRRRPGGKPTEWVYRTIRPRTR
jgi:hypothetical protein